MEIRNFDTDSVHRESLESSSVGGAEIQRGIDLGDFGKPCMTIHDFTSPAKRSGTKSASGNAWRNSASVINRTSRTSRRACSRSAHGPLHPHFHLRINDTRMPEGIHCQPKT